MKIKKLEMAGFKSFVERTIVHFDHDVLGIVGPNGCGKSNIVDAIRWCMGEQSAKHLRGRSMEDVLFNGSESRGATDFAEVTLTFENDDGDVPVEYRDYPEIAVTRRLHRTGDSEYLINKTQVRLKDVTDLFLGTGIGTKAYSIIEQGKIGLIVSAKPEDRRLLIEEAAGITKYKSKKKQAERKMELTQQNLLRVGDIVAEIERSLGSLKRQAAKAERYISYKGELEDLQLWEASARYLETVGWIKLESAESEHWTLEHDNVRAQLVAREADLETARLETHAAEEVLEGAQTAHFGAENEVRAEQGAIARATDRLAALREREVQAGAEAAQLAAQAERLEGERAQVAGDVEHLAGDEGQRAAAMEGEEGRLAELAGELAASEAVVADLARQASSARAQIASAEAQLAGFERRQTEMTSRREKRSIEREELVARQLEVAARAGRISADVDDLRAGKTTSAEEKERLEKRLGELRQEITASERALEEARSELGRKRSRLHALQEVQRRLDGVGGGARALMGTGDATIVGLVADRLEAPAGLTGAVAGLLGTRLEDVIVEDTVRGMELLDELARGKKGRATIAPRHPRYVAGAHATLPQVEGLVGRLVDQIRYAEQDEPLVHALLGDAVVVTDLEAAQRVREALGRRDGEIEPLGCAQHPIVTLTGTVLFPDGRVAGGVGENVAAGMLDNKREARELEEQVQSLDALATERLARHQALRGEIAEVQTGLEGARQRAHSRELALVTAEGELRSLQTEASRATARTTALDGELSELETALAEAGNERQAAAERLQTARAALEEAVAHSGEAEARAAGWRVEVDGARRAVTDRKVALAMAREKLSAARGTLVRLERSTAELVTRRDRIEEELLAGARAYGETAALLVLHRERLGLALDAKRVAEDALATARGAYEELRSGLMEREGALRELRDAVDLARTSLQKHEMALREHELTMRHLIEGVAERFRGLNLARVVGDYHLRMPPGEEARSRIGELTHLIERMGSVNLDAMRELEEAEKRFTFYSTQKADLDKALADLERAIQQMNRESKRLFAETFEAVNAKFQEIFPRMFRGGGASLRLTNPEDMLETGIDILAQPPGKKLSSIELMSGGEKALTAVSLIFAIFQIKPSPFCILDEVDAPLDEANVARYNEMIRSMTDRSQFILITHIKRTMQLVDVLYGVTMGEPGVSRLVSVKINESEQKRAPRIANAQDPGGEAPAAAVA